MWLNVHRKMKKNAKNLVERFVNRTDHKIFWASLGNLENTGQAFYKIPDLKVLSIERIRPKLGLFDRSSFKREARWFF
jgi:hypothetical protein